MPANKKLVVEEIGYRWSFTAVMVENLAVLELRNLNGSNFVADLSSTTLPPRQTECARLRRPPSTILDDAKGLVEKEQRCLQPCCCPKIFLTYEGSCKENKNCLRTRLGVWGRTSVHPSASPCTMVAGRRA